MYPSIITTFSYPVATDRLNNPSHSALENLQSSTIGQMQAVIGIDTSVLGTIIGDLRNPSSGGGGHVQTANKGGTGQTTYTKGDILVATSSSVLSKFAIGVDGTFLRANSSTASGVQWNAGAGKVFASVLGSIIGHGVVTETSVFSVTIPGSTLGANNAIRATLKAKLTRGNGDSSMLTQLTYGGARVASVLLSGTDASPGAIGGGVECWIVGGGSSNVQTGVINPLFGGGFTRGSSIIALGMDSGSASVASDANQTLGITWRFSDGSTGSKLEPVMVIVEKIT